MGLEKIFLSFCLLFLMVTSSAGTESIPWPIHPANEPHPIGNSFGEYQEYTDAVFPNYRHTGIDIRGEPSSKDAPDIISNVEGLVEEVSISSDEAAVYIRGKDGYLYGFEHIDPNSLQVGYGDKVEVSGTIGKIMYWKADKPDEKISYHHLHFEKMDDSGTDLIYLNPLSFIGPKGDNSNPKILEIFFCQNNSNTFFTKEPNYGWIVKGEVDIIAEVEDTINGKDNVGIYRIDYAIDQLAGEQDIPWTTLCEFTSFDDYYSSDIALAIYKNHDPCNSVSEYWVPNEHYYYIVTNTKNGEVDETGGYWDTSQFPDGKYEVKVRAWDISGNVGVKTVMVTVDNDGDNLQILEPTKNQPVWVGAYSDPRNLLIRLRFDLIVENLSAEQFEVTIGNKKAEIITGGSVLGEYWLVVKPPDQEEAGAYDLKVVHDLGIHAEDTEQDTINYSEEEAPPIDYVNTIDRTFSMLDFGKMEAAINAAKFFVDLAADWDKMGIVSYATKEDDWSFEITDKAFDELGAKGWPQSLPKVKDNRKEMIKIIDKVWPRRPYTNTSIGAGLLKAKEILDEEGDPDRKRVIVLLSDGLENRPPYWKTGKPNAHSEFLNLKNPIHFHTVALGLDADHTLMEDISKTTPQGKFWPVYLGSSLSLPNRLAEVYKYINEETIGEYRIWSEGGSIGYPETLEKKFILPPGMLDITLAVNWLKPKKSPCKVSLFKPDGSQIASTDPGVEIHEAGSNCVFMVKSPPAGEWTLKIQTFKESTEYLAALSGHSKVSFMVKLGKKEFTTYPNMSLPIFAILSDTEAILSASVEAKIQRPDKSWETLMLYDDGGHGDGGAGDGIYGATYSAAWGGFYLAKISASGESNTGSQFVFEKALGFYNPWEKDKDLDDLPNLWEDQYFEGEADPQADPDGDGLTNLEEYKYGTNPTLGDSDGDGIDDLTEIKAGTNPKKKPRKGYGLSFHLGRSIPMGSFANDYHKGNNVTVDLDYHLTSQLSLIGMLGYSDFKASTFSLKDTYFWNLSSNLKYEFTTQVLRPYIRGGGGLYLPQSGGIKFGLNLGAGLDYSLNPDWVLELGADYHSIFTSDTNTDFIISYIGVIFYY
jgi:hypothetical protein